MSGWLAGWLQFVLCILASVQTLWLDSGFVSVCRSFSLSELCLGATSEAGDCLAVVAKAYLELPQRLSYKSCFLREGRGQPYVSQF